MMYAYDESYLYRARISLGNMLHFAVYDMEYDIASFYGMFLNSRMSERFGNGEPSVIAGCSGVELAYNVIYETTGRFCNKKPSFSLNKTPEYWTGWALAYYQWCRAVSFERINEAVPVKEVVSMYSPLHEADILKFVDIMDERMSSLSAGSRLARLRTYAGLTQKILAERSGVSVRMIEQYEQGRKDIAKASAETVLRLSQALHCRMDELL